MRVESFMDDFSVVSISGCLSRHCVDHGLLRLQEPLLRRDEENLPRGSRRTMKTYFSSTKISAILIGTLKPLLPSKDKGLKLQNVCDVI